MAIGEALKRRHDWEKTEDETHSSSTGGGTVRYTDQFEMRTFDTIHLDLVNVADVFDDPDAIVFVSKHAGDTGPLLTTHVPGNIGNAAHGGEPNSIPDAAPNLMKAVYRELNQNAPDGYDVAIECTHHGPSEVGAPTIFVEIGSGPDEWTDPAPAETVANAVLDLHGVSPRAGRTVVGFGGGHYAPRFTRIIRDTTWNVGHIAASWSLDEIEDPAVLSTVVECAIERSAGDVVLLDGECPSVANALEEINIQRVTETWIREVDDRSFDLIVTVETLLGSIDSGTRCGTQRGPSPDELQRVELPPELVDTLNGMDPDAAMDVISRNCIGYRTTENGNRLTGVLVLGPGRTVKDIIHELRPVLESHFEDVAIMEQELVLKDRAFDPDAARARGVPEGPSFGQLASGGTVTVDGEDIHPEEVLRERVQRIALGPI